MFSLGSDLLTEIEFNGDTLLLNTSFDTVFRYFQLIADEDFTEIEKLEIAFAMFVQNGGAVSGFEDKAEVLQRVLFDVLDFDNEDEDDEEPADGQEPKKLYDFEKDAGLLYASFLYDYNIDLFKEQGRLHWLQFKSLFESLSEEARISKVIGYRGMKTPSTKDSSPEYRKFIIDMKRKYRLEPPTENEEQLQNQFAGLFHHLKAKARG